MNEVTTKTKEGDLRKGKESKRLPWTTLRVQIFAPLALVLAAPIAGNAAVFNIPGSDVNALIAAITTANSNGEDDEIVLAASAYSLSAVNNSDGGAGPNGLPSITSTITLSVTSTGPATIERVAGAPNFRIFHVGLTGNLTLDGLVVTGGVSSGRGGGIFNEGVLEVINSTVSSNTSSSGGGGIFNSDDGMLSITNSTIGMNRNDIFGGGGINTRGTAILDKSTVSDNTSGAGGGTGGAGIFNADGTLTITNSTISGNKNSSGNGRGGGIDSGGAGATLNLNNVTITNNSTQLEGGGIFNFASANVKNTIIAGNISPTRSSGGPDCGGTLNSLGFNLILNTTGCTINGDTTGNITGRDSRLLPLADNGGPTKTHALLPNSPAVDAVTSGCPPPNTDQRGVTRPQKTACDIGAFELEAVTDLEVSKGDSPDPVRVGNNLTYFIDVTNFGPNNATSVTLTDTLPTGVTFVSATPIQGSCSGTTTVTCNLGNLAEFTTVSVEIAAKPTTAAIGTITNTATVKDDNFDPDASNNTDTEVTRVIPGVNLTCAGLGVTRAGTPAGETIIGRPQRDIIQGRGGNDIIIGLRGNDVICGGRGNDRLFGRRGKDALIGGRGKDICNGGRGSDTDGGCETRMSIP